MKNRFSTTGRERPRTQRRRHAGHAIGAVLAAGVAGVMGAACSGSGPTSSVASLPGHTTGTQPTGPLTVSQSDQDMVNFARCLRGHGVAEPDPYHRPGHQGLSIAMPAPGPSTNAALGACNHFIAPIAQMKAVGARHEIASWLPQLTHFAECLRAHDIAMLDPGAHGELNLGNVPGITNEFGRYSPQFRAADSACRHWLPTAVHDDGTGP